MEEKEGREEMRYLHIILKYKKLKIKKINIIGWEVLKCIIIMYIIYCMIQLPESKKCKHDKYLRQLEISKINDTTTDLEK